MEHVVLSLPQHNLSDRFQYVQIGNEKFYLLKMVRGVPLLAHCYSWYINILANPQEVPQAAPSQCARERQSLIAHLSVKCNRSFNNQNFKRQKSCVCIRTSYTQPERFMSCDKQYSAYSGAATLSDVKVTWASKYSEQLIARLRVSTFWVFIDFTNMNIIQ